MSFHRPVTSTSVLPPVDLTLPLSPTSLSPLAASSSPYDAPLLCIDSGRRALDSDSQDHQSSLSPSRRRPRHAYRDALKRNPRKHRWARLQPAPSTSTSRRGLRLSPISFDTEFTASGPRRISSKSKSKQHPSRRATTRRKRPRSALPYSTTSTTSTKSTKASSSNEEPEFQQRLRRLMKLQRARKRPRTRTDVIVVSQKRRRRRKRRSRDVRQRRRRQQQRQRFPSLRIDHSPSGTKITLRGRKSTLRTSTSISTSTPTISPPSDSHSHSDSDDSTIMITNTISKVNRFDESRIMPELFRKVRMFHRNRNRITRDDSITNENQNENQNENEIEGGSFSSSSFSSFSSRSLHRQQRILHEKKSIRSSSSSSSSQFIGFRLTSIKNSPSTPSITSGKGLGLGIESGSRMGMGTGSSPVTVPGGVRVRVTGARIREERAKARLRVRECLERESKLARESFSHHQIRIRNQRQRERERPKTAIVAMMRVDKMEEGQEEEEEEVKEEAVACFGKFWCLRSKQRVY